MTFEDCMAHYDSFSTGLLPLGPRGWLRVSIADVWPNKLLRGLSPWNAQYQLVITRPTRVVLYLEQRVPRKKRRLRNNEVTGVRVIRNATADRRLVRSDVDSSRRCGNGIARDAMEVM